MSLYETLVKAYKSMCVFQKLCWDISGISVDIVRHDQARPTKGGRPSANPDLLKVNISPGEHQHVSIIMVSMLAH